MTPVTKSVHLEIAPLSPPLPKEVDMFARNVSANLKPGTLAEFTETMENEIVPWLRKQKGFLDAITLAVPGGREVVAITFWDQKENAQAYNSTGYPEVLKILGKLLEGTPHVRTFDVVSSTLQKVVPRVAA
jgi:heme-degrading monooxygenase HmoA